MAATSLFYANGYEAAPPAWIFIGLNLASVLALIYILMVLVRKDGRTVHDLAAKTVVH